MGTDGQSRHASRGRGPGRRGAGLALAALLVAPGAALAGHPSQHFDQKLNVDGDPAAERVIAISDVSSDHKVERAEVVIVDRCAGRTVRHLAAPRGKRLGTGDIRGPGALGRRAVLFTIGYGGTELARVVGLRPRPGQRCPSLRVFLSYSTSKPPAPPPSGLVVRDFSLVPRADTARYPGPELMLVEHYGASSGGPVSKRETFFGFSGGRYVSYRTRVVPAA